ncbi:hypothetical protein [uncultured Pseudokineococcus sp.]|uniref:hypothetical protein n=1 Tax=uncultured Pseudokineococcus sp. TaxID=1642928 RepID=UPI00263734E1|nr:hypothetical protein [uncultured Pseudokineococcus sp.]
MAVALLAALAAMLANTAATLLESHGSRRARTRGPVWREPTYLAGLALDALGWLLAVVALRSLPVITVQSVLTSSVALTTLASYRFRVRDLPGAQLAGVLGVVVGLVLVAGSSSGDRPPDLPTGAAPVLLATAVLLAVLVVPLTRCGRPFLVAAVAGISYGGAALGVRALHLTPDVGADLALLARPLLWAVVLFGVVGVVLVAAALRDGAPGPVTAVLSVTEVVVPGSAGLVLLGDAVRPGWGWALVVGVVAVVGSVAVLARARGSHLEEARAV